MTVSSLSTVDYSQNVGSYFGNTSKKESDNSLAQNQEEQKTISKLKEIDQKVRAHEMAHLSAGAGVTKGGASYSFKRGPDGRNYAVAGEVPIDLSPGKTPQETIWKMQRVQAAALAPADPSPQDLKVASKAAQIEADARAELYKNDQQTSTISIWA